MGVLQMLLSIPRIRPSICCLILYSRLLCLKYIAFVLATICVFVFQFVAHPICITLALAFYVVAFGLMTASLVVRCVELYSAEKVVKEENAIVVGQTEVENNKEILNEAENSIGEEVEVVNLKAEKFWSVFGASFFGLFTIFTFIVLILF